jgi:hypothetical protein
MPEEPEIIRTAPLSVQVCVPAEWSDETIKEWTDTNHLCGTTNGWQIRKDTERLNGDPDRNNCSTRLGFVHITLDA